MRSPLYAHHQAAGARFVTDDGWEVPAEFRSLEAEYRAATQGVALADRSPMGRLQATGPDVLDLLNRLSTNRVDPLEPGTGEATVLTTNKGRIIDWITVLHLGDRTDHPHVAALLRGREAPGSTATPSSKT